MLWTVNTWHQSMQVQLVTAEIKVAQDALAVVVLVAFRSHFGQRPGPLHSRRTSTRLRSRSRLASVTSHGSSTRSNPRSNSVSRT